MGDTCELVRPFLTVTVGEGDVRDTFRATREAGGKVTEIARSMMMRTAFPREKSARTITLVRTTVGAYGFRQGATFGQVLSKARSDGRSCPCETALACGPLYAGPQGERLVVISETVAGMNTVPPLWHRYAFMLERPGSIPTVHFLEVHRGGFLKSTQEIVLLAA